MSAPKQCIGLSISKCPPNPDAIRSIVFTRPDNLSVVNGASTEIQVSLTNFFVPISQAVRSSFTLPGKKSSTAPYTVYKLDFGGIEDITGGVKFFALFPQYAVGATASSSFAYSPVTTCNSNSLAVTSAQEYIEWAGASAIENGQLFVTAPIGVTGYTNFSTNEVNRLEFEYGTYISFSGGTGPLYAATNGGLLMWNGSEMKLWNTQNSNSPSDYISSIAPDAYGNLWVGSNNGISKFSRLSSPNAAFSSVFNTQNSSILSNNVNDLKILSVDRVAVATDQGLSLYNFVGGTWSNFTSYNTPELYFNNIENLQISNDFKIYMGTTGGVFVYDTVANSWNSTPYNSTNTPGWTSPDSVKALSLYGGNLYVGTTGGLVIIGITGSTAQTVFAGSTGPLANDYNCLKGYLYGDGVNRMYAGHGSGFSILDIDSQTWGPTGASGDWGSTGPTGYPYLAGGVNDLVVDALAGTTGGQTIFFGNFDGLAKWYTGDSEGNVYIDNDYLGDGYFPYTTSDSLVPESNAVTNLLMTIPNNANQLYSIDQPMYFIFSKTMNTSSFENFTSLYEGSTAGATSSLAWAWSDDDRTAQATPTSSLDRAQAYFLSVAQGSTSVDGAYLKEKVGLTFYTEDIAPILGWEPIGKLMIHTGTEGHLTHGIYLRNPQSFDVNVIALIGR